MVKVWKGAPCKGNILCKGEYLALIRGTPLLRGRYYTILSFGESLFGVVMAYILRVPWPSAK